MSKRTYEEYKKNGCSPVGYNEPCQSYYFGQVSVDLLLDQIDQLKQQLYEKDCRIEELEGQFAYECECNKQLVDLQKQLAELKEKAIVPRFKYGDKVYYIRFFWGEWRVFNQSYVAENRSNIIVRTMNYYGELPKDSVFATGQEAQAKLKEIQGE